MKYEFNEGVAIEDCPFCDNSWGTPQPEQACNGGRWHVSCMNPHCGASSGFCDSEDEAISHWNKRNNGQISELTNKLAAAQASAATLALYAQHRRNCTGSPTTLCTCGLDAILTRNSQSDLTIMLAKERQTGEDEMKCYHCGSPTEELRPYGPKGAMICFPCMKSSPERESEAKRNFAAQLSACGSVALIGTEAGPYPAEHNPAVMEKMK